MLIPINQVIAFKTVAQTGSFADAAIELHLSQPALSIAIRNLEETLGGKLLSRTTRSVTLTPEGKAFYPVARRLLSDWEQSMQDVRNHFALQRGKFEIAAMPTFTTNHLPTILKQFHKDYPSINVTIHDVIAENVIEMVREGRCELGVAFEPLDARDLSFVPLYQDRFILVLTNGHPLLEKKQIRWTDMLKYNHILLQRPASIRQHIDQALLDRGIKLQPTFETHQLGSAGQLVKQGLGISVVPDTSRAQMQMLGLVCREISSPVITHKVGMIKHRQKPLSTAAQVFESIILDYIVN